MELILVSLKLTYLMRMKRLISFGNSLRGAPYTSTTFISFSLHRFLSNSGFTSSNLKRNTERTLDRDFNSVQGVKLQEGIGKLTNRQNLSLVKVGQKGRILKDLKALTQLRKLGVTGLRREHGKDLCAAVEAMQSIRTLDITSVTKEELIEVEEMRMNPPRKLQCLYLKGRLEKIPTWISQLDNLVRIGLKWSKLSDSPLEILKCLPNLMELQMVDCFTGDILRFEAHGFENLKILVMKDLYNVKTVVIEEGAMPKMKKISLSRCHELRTLLGINHLDKVEELTLYDMGKELVD